MTQLLLSDFVRCRQAGRKRPTRERARGAHPAVAAGGDVGAPSARPHRFPAGRIALAGAGALAEDVDRAAVWGATSGLVSVDAGGAAGLAERADGQGVS